MKKLMKTYSNLNLSLRIYMLLCMVMLQIRMWAQSIDDDSFVERQVRKGDTQFDLNGMEEMPNFHIRISDILLLLLLIAAIYVFRKIWRGCSLLLIGVAILLYFLTH